MPANKVTGPGSYNVICDDCGFKYKNYELTKRPSDGAMVCKYDWEPRHPQEFIRAIKDNKVLPYIRTEPDGIDVGPAVNCDTLTFTYQTLVNLNAELVSGSMTIYKLRVY